MTTEYGNIYDQLFVDYGYEFSYRSDRSYPFFPNEATLIRAVRRAIDGADKEARLRADARYFMLVNLHQMVILPILIGRYGPYEIPDRSSEYLENAIEQDVTAVVQNALDTSRGDSDQQGLSAHQIMTAVNNIWDRLKTAEINLWG
jgi:hypothetical protein